MNGKWRRSYGAELEQGFVPRELIISAMAIPGFGKIVAVQGTSLVASGQVRRANEWMISDGDKALTCTRTDVGT